MQNSKDLFNQETVGRNLKRILKTRKITQQAFAGMVYVDIRTVSRWCNIGLSSLDTIFWVAKVLGVDPMVIISDADDDPVFFFQQKLNSRSWPILRKF